MAPAADRRRGRGPCPYPSAARSAGLPALLGEVAVDRLDGGAVDQGRSSIRPAPSLPPRPVCADDVLQLNEAARPARVSCCTRAAAAARHGESLAAGISARRSSGGHPDWRGSGALRLDTREIPTAWWHSSLAVYSRFLRSCLSPSRLDNGVGTHSATRLRLASIGGGSVSKNLRKNRSIHRFVRTSRSAAAGAVQAA